MQTVTERPRTSSARSASAKKGALSPLGSPLARKPVLGDGGIFAKNGKKDLGLAVLTALSIAGIHSAVNPSLFTLRSFAARPEARAAAVQGLWIGLGASIVASGAILFVFDGWVPAAVGAATGVGLFLVGMWAVHSPPLPTMPLIQEQVGP